MYDLSDFRKGLKILFENDPFVIVDFQHVKPGKGNQFTRTKMRNMLTGQNREMTFKQGEKFGVPDVVFKDMTYLFLVIAIGLIAISQGPALVAPQA